ncbi:hypothetical protein ACQUQU_12950 [Thalassolituus sp. LLYu03]|uniref:hypothetical protein n=1 Tax=Thalassolituus sp. LLYu03 TaxID=3421656 RepID=UPI003D2B20A8
MSLRYTPATLALSALLLSSAHMAQAAERSEVDSDHNGLIEINDLDDLNEIRNNPLPSNAYELHGTHLYGNNGGCPTAGCNGYELTADLNFDTNGNQRFDAGDRFWNNGKGFEPIGNFNLKFAAEFHGQNHTLHNLTIHRPGEYFTALFGYLEMASVHHLNLTADIQGGGNSAALAGYAWRSLFYQLHANTQVTASDSTSNSCGAFCNAGANGGLIGSGEELMVRQVLLKTRVTGADETGGLAGYLADSNLDEIGVQAEVSGDSMVGGLSGKMTLTAGDSAAITSSVKRSFVAARVNGENRVGVLAGSLKGTDLSDVIVTGDLTLADRQYVRAGAVVGSMDGGSSLRLLATVRLPANSGNTRFIGSFAGESSDLVLTDIQKTHVASDLARRSDGSGKGSLTPSQHYLLSHIQCATAANACDSLQYSDWNTVVNSGKKALWTFGSQDQVPGVVLPQATLVDADANGVADSWPAMASPDPVDPDPVDPDPVTPTPGKSSGGGALLMWLWLLPLTAVLRRRTLRPARA